jgi:hypothetical protein
VSRRSCVHGIGALLAALDAPAPRPGGGRTAEGPVQSIAVDVDETDAILHILAEQSRHQAALRRDVTALEEASRLATVLSYHLERRGAGEGDGGASPRALAMAEDLRKLLGRVRRSVSVATEQADRDHSELRSAAERLSSRA